MRKKTADRILSRRESFQAPLAELKQNTEEFDLNNVIFSFADEGFDGKLKFVMDENNTGEIKAINLLPDEEDLAEDPNDPGLIFTRINKTHGFGGQVNTEQGWVDGVLTYNSLGKDMKLKYADFGYFDIDVIDNWRPVFAGGYNNKKIPTNDITTSTTFTGRAVGSVMARREHLDEMYEDQTQLPLDAPATLVFDKENNKTTRLTANFANWYDIVYTENDVNGKSITFSNYTDTPLATKKIVDGHETDENITINNYYKLESDNGSSFVIDNSAQLHNDHDEYFDPVESAISYFGDNNIATEAAGLIQVNDCQGGECNDANNVLRMNLTFGAKK